MKKNIAYLISALLVGCTVFAIMRWVFNFDNTESAMFGFIAATAESIALYILRFFQGKKKDSSV